MNDLQNLAHLGPYRSYAISPENPTGERGRGGMRTEGTGAACAARLGQGWKVSPSVEIPPGETWVLADIAGCGMIQSMWFGGVVGRDYILRMTWDDAREPQVQAPLPDFFACGWMESVPGRWTDGPAWRLSSLPVCVNPNRGMNCFWHMPFSRHALITLENKTDQPMRCYYQIHYALGERDANAARFHARYRCAAPLPKGESHTILDGVRGTGQYVGTALSVGLNRDARWWGEGEIKFHLDDDGPFPTICGTGTEDYFGGSFNWEIDGRYATYTTPYLGMHFYQPPDGLYHIQPRFSMYRWHIADPIRFDSGLRVTLQDLGWQADGTYLQRQDDFHSVAFWYQM